MATVSETADSYPELDAIPAATPRPAISRAHSSLSVPIPSWARALFARFPLHTWEPAQPAPLASSPPTKPILYVAPPHPPRAGPSATGDKAAQGWASRDASSLEWQVELLFRGFDFDCAYIEEKEAWGPGGTLPYLHLPPSAQSRAGARGGGALVSARALPQWIETHAPIVKPELGQSNENGDDGYPDEKTREEAKAWASLVEGKLMAAVLLQSLLAPEPSSADSSAPLLSSFVSSHLSSARRGRILSRIATLSSGSAAGSAGSTASVPAAWDVRLSAWIGGSSLSNDDGTTQEGEEGALSQETVFDEEEVVTKALEALEAIGLRMEDDVQKNGTGWFLGSRRPTPLDARLFALLHTILSLPVPSKAIIGSTPGASLRAAVERHPTLGAWTRRVWREWVRSRGG